ncbi:MAG: hypothetical protein R3Y09_03635 [Clostridia bacterium]
MKKRKGFLYADMMLSSLLISIIFLFSINIYNLSNSYKTYLIDCGTLTDVSLNIISTLQYEMSLGNEIEDYHYLSLPSNSSVFIEKSYIYDIEIYVIHLDLKVGKATSEQMVYLVNLYD